MNNGVIQKKITMDKQLGPFREIKNYHFLETYRKYSDLNELEKTIVFYRANKFSEKFFNKFLEIQ